MSHTRIVVSSSQSTTPSERATGTFTGEAWRDGILGRQDGMSVADVHFSPCARTNWHTHEGGQLLFIRSGEGYVGDQHGGSRVVAGDVVWTPPGVRHWHGAAADRCMLHTAVSLLGVEWSDPVSDAEYTQGIEGSTTP
ncbi:Cupin domain protein [Microbacterium sp. cf046]|uniref:cupin domain-containing protein n=1 Tax=Microbacterium sp. cf046 TaxID=1761803 RepID=UPI0008E691E5|nr:cupin domain-containing protein [Microbacterium sp. cf046]SFS16747.1 Cupin domain protein [Microbacterium sp. cf046]